MQKVRTKFANSAFQSRKKCINLNIKILQQKWTNHKNPKNVASSALLVYKTIFLRKIQNYLRIFVSILSRFLDVWESLASAQNICNEAGKARHMSSTSNDSHCDCTYFPWVRQI